MRALFVIAIAAGLAGCSDSDFVDHPISSLIPSLSSDDAVKAEVKPQDSHCMTVAKLRARDAAYAGEDTDTQHSVYDKTYSECTDWDARHNS